MLKKILYIITTFLLGAIIMINVLYYNFYDTFTKFTAEAVDDKNYSEAERYYSRVIYEDKFYTGDTEDGMHIEVYAAINDIPVKNAEDGQVEYYFLENSIQFSFFHLPSDFATVDKVEGENVVARGGVRLTFADTTETVFFPFVNDYIDGYSNVSSFAFLPLTIGKDSYESALTEKSIALDTKLVGATIIDGDGDEEASIIFTAGNEPTYDTEFSNAFNPVVLAYNAAQKDLNEGKEVTEETSNEIANSYNTALESNEKYLQQHDFNIIYKSFDFLFPLILTAVIYLIIVIVIGWLLFRKKKAPKYVPPGQKKKAATPTEPEQFTRDVFNLEENDVVEEPAETPAEETSSQTDTE